MGLWGPDAWWASGELRAGPSLGNQLSQAHANHSVGKFSGSWQGAGIRRSGEGFGGRREGQGTWAGCGGGGGVGLTMERAPGHGHWAEASARPLP